MQKWQKAKALLVLIIWTKRPFGVPVLDLKNFSDAVTVRDTDVRKYGLSPYSAKELSVAQEGK